MCLHVLLPKTLLTHGKIRDMLSLPVGRLLYRCHLEKNFVASSQCAMSVMILKLAVLWCAYRREIRRAMTQSPGKSVTITHAQEEVKNTVSSGQKWEVCLFSFVTRGSGPFSSFLLRRLFQEIPHSIVTAYIQGRLPSLGHN